MGPVENQRRGADHQRWQTRLPPCRPVLHCRCKQQLGQSAVALAPPVQPESWTRAEKQRGLPAMMEVA